jgi:hypothetical protein
MGRWAQFGLAAILAWSTCPAFPAADSSDSWAREREKMVRDHLRARDITDREVLRAMGTVPRHEFVPDRYRIVQQPVGLTINCNGNANFSMQAAAGYEASTYAWEHFGAPMTNGVTPHGSLVSGANTATLSITNAKAPDIGSYRCVVQNGSCGSVNSTAVTMRVNNCCPGDIASGDLMINIDDLLAVINAWGWTGPTGGHPADINASGEVNIDDMLAIINLWGTCN